MTEAELNNTNIDEKIKATSGKSRQSGSKNWTLKENATFIDAMKELGITGNEPEKSTIWTALNVLIANKQSVPITRTASAESHRHRLLGAANGQKPPQ